MNNKNKYPILRVMTLYPFLGGIIFCVISVLIMWLILLTNGVKFSLEYFYFYLMTFYFIGFILNLIISFIIVIFKMTNRKYSKIFGVGFLVCFLASFIFLHPDMNAGQAFLFVLGFGLLGGTSSVILAKFILPKS